MIAGKVMAILDPYTIVIDRGWKDGVLREMVFYIYFFVDIRDPEYGENGPIRDRLVLSKAQVKASRVLENISYCHCFDFSGASSCDILTSRAARPLRIDESQALVPEDRWKIRVGDPVVQSKNPIFCISGENDLYFDEETMEWRPAVPCREYKWWKRVEEPISFIWSSPTVTREEARGCRKFFKREIFLEDEPLGAHIYVTVDDECEVFVNDLSITRAASASSPRFAEVNNLKKGANLLNFIVTNLPNPEALPEQNPAGLCYKLIIFTLSKINDQMPTLNLPAGAVVPA